MIKQLSPYSIQGINKVISNYLTTEWKGLSKIKGKETSLTFNDMLNEIIQAGLTESTLMFENELILHVERIKKERVEKNEEYNTKSKQTKALENLQNFLLRQSVINNNIIFSELTEKVSEQIKKQYSGLDTLKPRRLENITDNNLEKKLKQIKETKKVRLDKFKGLHYKRLEYFHFIDATTPPIVYYSKKNNSKAPFEVLIAGIMSYVLKLNEVKNTKKIIKKINDLEYKTALELDYFDPFSLFDKPQPIQLKTNAKLQAKEKREIFNLLKLKTESKS